MEGPKGSVILTERKSSVCACADSVWRRATERLGIFYVPDISKAWEKIMTEQMGLRGGEPKWRGRGT